MSDSDLSIHADTDDDFVGLLFERDPLACFSFFTFLAGGGALSELSSTLGLSFLSLFAEDGV